MFLIYRAKWMKLFSLTFKTRFVGLSFRRCAKPDFHHSSLFAFPCAFIQHVRFVLLVSSSSKIAKQMKCDLTTTPSCVQEIFFKKTQIKSWFFLTFELFNSFIWNGKLWKYTQFLQMCKQFLDAIISLKNTLT